MQTFLPYPDFYATAKCLDLRRLGKQRIEGKQIIETLLGISSGWKHHPAVKMWQRHVGGLAAYTIIICDEWIGKGYKDTQKKIILSLIDPDENDLPDWIGLEKFHASHRAALLAKKLEWYSQFNWMEEPKIEYFWPRIYDAS